MLNVLDTPGEIVKQNISRQLIAGAVPVSVSEQIQILLLSFGSESVRQVYAWYVFRVEKGLQ